LPTVSGFEKVGSMRIALDALEAGVEPLTGTGWYVRELLSRLPVQFVTPFCRRGNSVPGAVALRSPLNRTVWSQARLPVALARRRFDVVHIPGPRVPWLVSGKLVSTIHDVAFMKFPEMFRPSHRQRLEFFTRQAVRRSTRLITISTQTKRDLCEVFGADPSRVDVVHHGVDHRRFFPGDVKSATPYILSVGALQPRKNFKTLVEAYRLAKLPAELWIAGQRGWMWEEIEAQAGNGVRFLGYVPDEELAGLYRGAQAVVMPSLYEGFGLPLLEAMACGVPVVAANASCFPEVTGGAAVLVEPLDVNGWTVELQRVCGDDTHCQELRERGLKRAAEFSWERTAEETLEVYRKALS
jgi:glycosyltransferase involved in cell wall biosynthesis